MMTIAIPLGTVLLHMALSAMILSKSVCCTQDAVEDDSELVESTWRLLSATR